MTADTPILTARGITKTFGQPPQPVLHGIDLDVARGELLALTGKSGSGKSTLLYIISTLDLPTTGDVRLLDVNPLELNDRELHRLRNRHIGFVFQFHYLLPELTGLENVLMPARKEKEETARQAHARELLETFGVAHCADKRPGQMSGGEQQRVAIARALVMEPDIVFADEPTGNLDSENSEIVMSIFERINREQGTTVVYITHDPDLAARGRRRVVVHDGRIIA
ncbi:MAG: ABC transporter ATP-binding protein, partial [Candidatus Dadabacteria bacterium]